MSVLKSRNGNSTEKTAFVSAVIVAAGSSLRMGGVNKQMMLLNGVPVLIRSVLAFESLPIISEIIISARESDIPDIYALLKEYRINKVKTVVKGGETRQESVRNAVAVCSQFSDFIAIHDGARPLVSEDTIEQTVIAAMQFGAAACAVRVKDTIKVFGTDGFIKSTPDRESLWAVHTPQAFSSVIYKQALSSVESDAAFTDDCQMVESIGGKVKIVEDSYNNIKITTPDDLILAQAILESEEV